MWQLMKIEAVDVDLCPVPGLANKVRPDMSRLFLGKKIL
jgi:hypothetical protein